MVKDPSAMQESWVQSLGREDPLEAGMATHSSVLAWRGAWWATVRGVAESQARVKQLSMNACIELIPEHGAFLLIQALCTFVFFYNYT